MSALTLFRLKRRRPSLGDLHPARVADHADPIDVDGVTLSRTSAMTDRPTSVPAYILIETVERRRVRASTSVSTRGSRTHRRGVSSASCSRPPRAGSILAGASMSLSGYGFAAPETGGRVEARPDAGPASRREHRHQSRHRQCCGRARRADRRRRHHWRPGSPLHLRVRMSRERARHGRGQRDPVRSRQRRRRRRCSAARVRRTAVHRLLCRSGRRPGRQPGGRRGPLSERGQTEGRQIDLFSETQYLKNYGDLQAAFGTTPTKRRSTTSTPA